MRSKTKDVWMQRFGGRALALVVSALALAGCGGGAATTAIAGSRDVSFASGALQLKGRLHVPEDATGRRAAVVLVHGSGPQSRDAVAHGQLAIGFGCGVSVFEDLAEGLEDAGFVVLRYDKRTCGPFNDCADNGYPMPSVIHVIDDLVADAAAGVRWLAAQPDVDAKRIYVVGHSEGGQLVPRLLTDVAELRAGVMLAAPFRPIDAVMGEQVALLDAMMKAEGKDGEATQATLSDLHAQVAALEKLRAGSYEGARIGSAPSVYWKSWMKLGDEAPALAVATKKPLLALSGSYDWNVPKSETEAWQEAFALAKETSAAHAAEVVPCVTHAMSCIRQPNPERIRKQDIDCEVDAEVIEKVVGFLKKH
jgi:poly(3-hydroxybutyrate) depolymerase